MKMLPLHRQFVYLAETVICAGLFISGPVKASDVFKDNNANNLTDPLSWVGGLAAPTASDVGVWDSTVLAANTTVLGADASWGGIRIASPGGLVTINAGNALTLGSSGIYMGAASQNLTLNNAVTVGAAQNWTAGPGRTLTAAGAVAINNPLTVNGSGNVVLGVANTGSGGVTLSSGTLTLSAGASAGVSTTLALNGGTLALGADTSSGINIAIGGPVLVSIGNNRVLGGNSSSTTISGSGTLTFSGLTSSRTFTFSGNMSGFTGTIDLGANNGAFRFNSGGGSPALGNASATFNLGTGSGSLNNRNGGITASLGALSGGSSTVLSGRSNGSGGTSTTYSIGGLGTDTIFAGTIQNGGDNNGVNITKIGVGKLTLSGTSTYSGATTVNGGTLEVDGNLSGAGAVTVGLSGRLIGIGKITGSTTVNGEVAPGDSIGTLTFNNALTLAGLTTMEINRNSAQNADLLNVGLTLTCGGTLTVLNTGADLLQGDSFNLFDGSIASSSPFTTINLPSLVDPGLEWDLSQIYTTGIISVQQIPEPATFALLGIGGLVAAWQIRRRKV